MSEYQYYEFRTIDRPLSAADRQELRDLSTRAEITATSFTNSYEWGDFKGNPATLMERWFDLHLYLANWGTRRLMIRLPAAMVDLDRIDAFLENVDFVQRWVDGNLILDIRRDELEFDELDEGSELLADLTPLRSDVLAGDLRLFYLLWLTAVEDGLVEDDEPEPMSGIGPLTAALEAFAAIFAIDIDLVHAAAERRAPTAAISADAVRNAIAMMPGPEKDALLVQLVEGAPLVATTLRAEIRKRLLRSDTDAAPRGAARTAGELRARAEAVGLDRKRAEAERAAAERKKKADEAEKLRRRRMDAIAKRGESVWLEVETEIGRRNASGYDNAAGLLQDLKAIAEESGTIDDFRRRLRTIRERHAQKPRFIERLAAIG